MDVESAEKRGYMKTELISVSEVWVWAELKPPAVRTLPVTVGLSVGPVYLQTSVQAAGQNVAHVSGRLPRSGAVRHPRPRRRGQCALLRFCCWCQIGRFLIIVFVCLFFLPRCLQEDNLICGFEEFATEVDAALAYGMKLSSLFCFVLFVFFCGCDLGAAFFPAGLRLWFLFLCNDPQSSLLSQANINTAWTQRKPNVCLVVQPHELTCLLSILFFSPDECGIWRPELNQWSFSQVPMWRNVPAQVCLFNVFIPKPCLSATPHNPKSSKMVSSQIGSKKKTTQYCITTYKC